jgi:hypothetical protein
MVEGLHATIESYFHRQMQLPHGEGLSIAKKKMLQYFTRL